MKKIYIILFSAFIPFSVFSADGPDLLGNNTPVSKPGINVKDKITDIKDKITDVFTKDETDEKPNDNSEKQYEQKNSSENINVSETVINEPEQNNAEKSKTLENTLTGASIGATAIGASQYMSAKTEQNTNKKSEDDMAAYITTFRCDYGNSGNVKGGEKEIVLPGGNKLISLYSEYKSLAVNLKSRKNAMGLQPGIESETIFDKSETGLYDDTSIVKDGKYTSTYRALSDSSSTDATELSNQKSETKKDITTGAIITGGGIVAGVAAQNSDAIQNTIKKLKNSSDNNSENNQ